MLRQSNSQEILDKKKNPDGEYEIDLCGVCVNKQIKTIVVPFYRDYKET